MKSYAGIGSRETPPSVISMMKAIGRQMAKDGIMLHTGNARGADQAFAEGANEVDPTLVTLWLPWPNFEVDKIVEGNIVHIRPRRDAQDIAEMLHPAWRKQSRGARLLHSRNTHIILNEDVFTPVDKVICWTIDGKEKGGTGQALRVANWWNLMNDSKIIIENLGARNATPQKEAP